MQEALDIVTKLVDWRPSLTINHSGELPLNWQEVCGSSEQKIEQIKRHVEETEALWVGESTSEWNAILFFKRTAGGDITHTVYCILNPGGRKFVKQ